MNLDKFIEGKIKEANAISDTFNFLAKPFNVLKTNKQMVESGMDYKNYNKYQKALSHYDDVIEGRHPSGFLSRFFGFKHPVDPERLKAENLEKNMAKFHKQHGGTIEEIKNLPYAQQKVLTEARKRNDLFNVPSERNARRESEEFTTRVTHPRMKTIEEFKEQFKAEPTVKSVGNNLNKVKKNISKNEPVNNVIQRAQQMEQQQGY